MYDYLIKNATVVDGTGAPRYAADVAVENGAIVRIAKLSNGEAITERARNTVDAKGQVLAPGFIDTHTHSDQNVFIDPDCWAKLKQGITTEVGGQCGWSRGPMPNRDPEVRGYLAAAVCFPERRVPILDTFEEELQRIEAMALGANQTYFVGHGPIRAAVVGIANRHATEDEIGQMKTLLRQSMEAGALGLSTGLVYAPGIYCDTHELIELAKVVAEYDGIYTSHMRNEANHVIESVQEVIRIAEESGVRANISHFKAQYTENWDKLLRALELIEDANARGLDITFDAYPYDACSANTMSTLPPSYLSAGQDALVEMLTGKENVEKLRREIYTSTVDWANPIRSIGLGKMLIVGGGKTPDAIGKTFAEYAAEHDMDDIEAYAYLMAANRGSMVDVRFCMSEENLKKVYQSRYAMVGTDGLYVTGAKLSHPRGFGSFPRFIGRYLREAGILSLEEGIHMITERPAKRYSLENKGVIREGLDADLVLFDYDTIIDHADYLTPFEPNEGIRFVMVGGAMAVLDDVVTGARNGRVIRKKRG